MIILLLLSFTDLLLTVPEMSSPHSTTRRTKTDLSRKTEREMKCMFKFYAIYLFKIHSVTSCDIK